MQKTDLSDHPSKTVLTSMRMPEALHQALTQQSRETGLSLAKTVGYLFEQHQKQAMEPKKPDYGLLSYILLQEAIHHFVENGQGFIDHALQKSASLQEPGQEEET